MVILDDTQLLSVAIVRDFLSSDPAWRVEFQSSKAIAFRKVSESMHNVAWYMQPFVARSYSAPASRSSSLLSLFRGLKRRLLG